MSASVVPFPPILPLDIKTGFEMEYSRNFDPVDLRETDIVKVQASDGVVYPRRFNRDEFQARNLKPVELLTAFHWKRPSTSTDEVTA